MEPTQIEATNAESVDVDYEGNTYTFPASLDEADGDVIDAIDEQKMSRALRGLLGDQWSTFKATKPKVKDYGGLFDAYAKRIGLSSSGE